MRSWRRLNNLPWYWRWPLKLGTFVAVTALVLYPKVWLFPIWLERIGDLNAMLDPGHAEIAGLEARVRESLPANPTAEQTLSAVQQAVYERVPYAWDWDTWGVCEYLPTVAEVFEQGREDCDGRAVVAASVLRRMGIDAWLVSDLLHVWVQTPLGETMSPTGGEKTFRGTDRGTHTTVSPRLIRNLARGFSYGVGVFPLGRELIILATLCLLAMHPRSSVWRRVAGCLVLWIALDMLRHGGLGAALSGETGDLALTWLGVVLAITGWLILAVRGGDPSSRPVVTRPE